MYGMGSHGHRPEESEEEYDVFAEGQFKVSDLFFMLTFVKLRWEVFTLLPFLQDILLD